MWNFAYFKAALIEKSQYSFMLMMNRTWLTYVNMFFSISQVVMKLFSETFQLADSFGQKLRVNENEGYQQKQRIGKKVTIHCWAKTETIFSYTFNKFTWDFFITETRCHHWAINQRGQNSVRWHRDLKFGKIKVSTSYYCQWTSWHACELACYPKRG